MEQEDAHQGDMTLQWACASAALRAQGCMCQRGTALRAYVARPKAARGSRHSAGAGCPGSRRGTTLGRTSFKWHKRHSGGERKAGACPLGP